MIKIDGLTLGAKPFSQPTQELLVKTLANLRTTFVSRGEQMKGARFKSDDKLLWAIASACTEDVARTNPEDVCTAALVWAAETDYWYEFEKDWE